MRDAKVELRREALRRRERQADKDELSRVILDRLAGGRLGHGFGYYDKLLQRARPGTTLVGLAFECQLFPQIPVEPHDVRLDRVVTEAAVY